MGRARLAGRGSRFFSFRFIFIAAYYAYKMTRDGSAHTKLAYKSARSLATRWYNRVGGSALMKRNTFTRPLSKARAWKLTARCRAQATRMTTCARKGDRVKSERGREREKRRERERERRQSWSARNSCDLMGFFDCYLMPVAIQPICTPLTYTEGMRKNRGFCRGGI